MTSTKKRRHIDLLLERLLSIGRTRIAHIGGPRYESEVQERHAVFANSDIMAIAAMRALKGKGRRVPEDVAVVGYDDLSLATYVSPALTTISQRIPLAGRILARDLVAYLEQGIVTNTKMAVELIVRESA
jgi:DNA-binding LacI/PurR family transcriptional regulator